MGWFRSKKKKNPSAPSEPTLTPSESTEPHVPDDVETVVDFDLTILLDALARRLPRFLGQPTDRALIEARLADAYRDSERIPMDCAKFEEGTGELDEEAWRRLAILVDLLDEEECWGSLDELLGSGAVEDQVSSAFVAFSRDTSLLTLATLRHGDLRREEFIRRWVMRLGGGIKGEAVAESLARLDRLDYGKLLTEAERARQLAEERTAYLKKLKEVEDARHPRGKW